ncbi:MAG: nucleotide pyrophosphohydrolase [Gemmatales bacterium]|nr:nucleotide pyrophosphohydrolase [Gemmatales bacterium]MDW8223862.1 nucleotide pyrophosphohydrolase [Gemmatales bacterium]
MNDCTITIMELRRAMERFVSEREWQRYHAPKNLVMGLAIETAELMEHFLWLDVEESRQRGNDPQYRQAITEELADVTCYVLALANTLQIDLSQAVFAKLEKNAAKYPVERYRGRFESD